MSGLSSSSSLHRISVLSTMGIGGSASVMGMCYPSIHFDKICRISTDTQTVAFLLFHYRLKNMN